MKKHLKYIDGNSDKFWQIEVSGLSYTVTYGKNGTSGVSQTKTFPDEEACLKTAEKLLAAKIKKGYSENGEVVISHGDNAGTATKKLSDIQVILNEYDEIIKSKKREALLPFFKENAKGNLEALKKQVKKNKRYWQTYIDLSTESVFKPKNSWGTRGDVIQAEIITLSALAIFNKTDILSWDEVFSMLEKPSDPLTLEILQWAKPNWIEEYLLEKIRKSEWLRMNYQSLRFMEAHSLISFNPELYALSIANTNEWSSQVKTRDFIQYILNDETAYKRDIPELFNYETDLHNNYFRDNKDQAYNEFNAWEIIFNALMAENKLDRSQLIENAILIQTKDWNSNLKSFFRKRLNDMEVTADELIPFQENIFAFFHHSFVPVVNYGIELVKKIFSHPKFKAKSFIEWVEPVMMRADCKAAVKGALVILEKLNKENPKLNKSIVLLAADLYLVPDMDLQEKATKLLLKIASEKDTALREKLSGYASLMQGNVRSSLDKFMDEDSVSPDDAGLEEYEYNPSTETRLSESVALPENWNEIFFLFGNFIGSNEVLDSEILLNVYITQRHLFPKNYSTELQPYFKQLEKTYFDSVHKSFMSVFLRHKISNINDSVRIKEGEYHKINTLLLIKTLIEIVQDKMGNQSVLPLLCFPTHKPHWVDPKTLMQRIIAHQSAGETIHPVDLAIAISRMPRENTEAAIPLITEIKGELQELMSFCLGVTQKISVASSSVLNKLFSRISVPKSHEHTSLWAVAARTFYPQETFREFDDTLLKDIPFVVSPFVPEVIFKEKWNEYTNYQTKQRERTPSWYELGFDAPDYRKASGNLLYSLDLNFKGNAWENMLNSEANVYFWNSLTPQNPDALACALLKFSCNIADGSKQELTGFLNVANSPGFVFSETTMQVFACCFFLEKKETRRLASEVLISLIENQRIDLQLLARKVAFLVSNKYGAFSRLADALSEIRDISGIHNSALFKIIDGILDGLVVKDKLPTNFKKMIENYTDLFYKTQHTPSQGAIAFLEVWKNTASLKPLIAQILK